MAREEEEHGQHRHQQHNSKFANLGEKLRENKEWLQLIVDCEGGKKARLRALLQTASTKRLVLLVTWLHHVCNGDAPVSSKIWTRISHSKKRAFICRNFERTRDLRDLKQKGRESILPLLFQLLTILPVILQPLFAS